MAGSADGPVLLHFARVITAVDMSTAAVSREDTVASHGTGIIIRYPYVPFYQIATLSSVAWQNRAANWLGRIAPFYDSTNYFFESRASRLVSVGTPCKR